MLSIHEQKERLIESIRLLAMEPDIQLSLFPNFVHKPDELALIFDDCFLFLPELIKNNLIKEDQAELIRDLDKQLSRMGVANKDIWTEESVETHTFWEEIRIQAKNVLSIINADLRKHNINWIRYIQ